MLKNLSKIYTAKVCARGKPLFCFSSQQNFQGYFRTRHQHLNEIQKTEQYDLIIIGGGCNGVGAFLDASTRGLKVLLLQKDDFGSGTSSKSTKLFHGGVRYLEQVFQLSRSSLQSRVEKFKLVIQSIVERGSAIRNNSYLSKKIPFVIPSKNVLQLAYYYVGSLFYYLIYKLWTPKNTPKFSPPKIIGKSTLKTKFPLISDQYIGGIVYEDGCFNDARLLIMVLLTASEPTCVYNKDIRSLERKPLQCNFMNRAQVKDLLKDNNGRVTGVVFKDRKTEKQYAIRGKYVLNCTGTWADTIRKIDDINRQARIIMVGGSHLTYDSKISNSDFGLCMPSKDGRIILIVPWLDRVIAGTTEVSFFEPTNNPKIIESEKNFIREAVQSTMSGAPFSSIRQMQISQWTGLRPLVLDKSYLNDTKRISRDFVIQQSESGLWSMMGGKWTIYRKMGEVLLNKIAEKEAEKGIIIPKSQTLQLGILGSQQTSMKEELITKYGEIGRFLYQNYGNLAQQIVKGDLSVLYGNVTRAQIEWICKNEMVEEVEDVLLRRTRIAFTEGRKIALQLVPEVARIMGQVKSLSEAQISDLAVRGVASLDSYQF